MALTKAQLWDKLKPYLQVDNYVAHTKEGLEQPRSAISIHKKSYIHVSGKHETVEAALEAL